MMCAAWSGGAAAEPAEAWAPAEVAIMSSWAESVTPENAWREYPRPQMVREGWANLNGLWDYAVAPLEAETPPEQWAGKILVPYALESSLSGVGKRLEKTQALWYRRGFEQDAVSGRLLLHFEAVDYSCTVWVNGKEAGKNTGGNLPFSFDITALVEDGENEVVVRVEDFTNDPGSYQLRGKQVRKPKGIKYTPVSGIWQTVWLEEVPEAYIDRLRIDTQIDPAVISVDTRVTGRELPGQRIRVTVKDGDQTLTQATSRGRVSLVVPDAELWSPASPKLYDLEVELLGTNGQVLDQVKSYAGIREIGETKGEHGRLLFTLNGEAIFHWGPLDQGWWPAGLLTPPSDEAMRFDVDYLKQAGFNMIRKHIKIESRRFYAYCDQVGMLVWQDQVSGGSNASAYPKEWVKLAEPKRVPDGEWPDWAHRQFMDELKGMVDTLYNHPSIVCWVPFNERWGQHRTMEVGRWIVDYDPSRHINIASGGNFWPIGDIADAHSYPHPRFPFDIDLYKPYISVIGEFGGHGLPVPGHRWANDGKNWGYGGLPENSAEYVGRFRKSLDRLIDFRKKGLAGAVYTQTTDVEIEINGLMTYDRKVIKIPADDLKVMSDELLE